MDLGSLARLNCTANDTLTASLTWLFRGAAVIPVAGETVVDSDSLVVLAVSWSHIGEYTCVLTVDGVSHSASATLNVTGTSDTVNYALRERGRESVHEREREREQQKES